uniref:Uncharacterized protein n=1 Tax=viral metagenome TaxID=1070528 RepID=A0A6C0HJ70_9ZZZZ
MASQNPQFVVSDPSKIVPAEPFHNGKGGEPQSSVSPSVAHTSMSPAQSGGNCMMRRGGRKSHKKHSRKSHKKHARKSHKKHGRKSHKKHHK